MKRVFTIVTIAAIAGVAVAQNSTLSSIDGSGLRLRVGAVYPWESATRKVTKNMVAVGVDFPIMNLLKKGESYVSVDWYGKSASGAKGNMFPVMVNQRLYLNDKEAAGSRTYVAIGVGIVHMDVTKAKTAYGARFALGKELSDNLSFEAAMVGSTEASGTRANSIGVFLGYRF